MEENALLELLKKSTDPKEKFVVGLQRPVPASRDPADNRKYVTFSLPVKLNGQVVHMVEERYSRCRRFHWRLVQLGILDCFNNQELNFPPMYWWRNMRDDIQNISMRARQLQTYFTRLLGNPMILTPFLEKALAAAAAKPTETSLLDSFLGSITGGDDDDPPPERKPGRPPPRRKKGASAGGQGGAAASSPAAAVDSAEEEMEDGGDDTSMLPEDLRAAGALRASRILRGGSSDEDEDGTGPPPGTDEALVALPDADDNFFGNPDDDADASMRGMEFGDGDGETPWWEETFYGKDAPAASERGGAAWEYTTDLDHGSSSMMGGGGAGGGSDQSQLGLETSMSRFVSYGGFVPKAEGGSGAWGDVPGQEESLFEPLSTQTAAEREQELFGDVGGSVPLPAPVE